MRNSKQINKKMSMTHRSIDDTMNMIDFQSVPCQLFSKFVTANALYSKFCYHKIGIIYIFDFKSLNVIVSHILLLNI